ncbi:MAG: hypothetical protein HMLKMBBP_03915 [Planctomycetes bacterium]|nr:hypothetical protein [Planctomycetota bacterium]
MRRRAAVLLLSAAAGAARAQDGAPAAPPSPPGDSKMHPSEGAAPRKANRLAKESSPYLLQHAHNPVDWWPWGDEAFEHARKTGRPVFLSIGYSTCHWCHVMARESFEDEAVAKLLADTFVCIKVDREERPDVDAVYMAAVQAMTGQGGWPLSAFLTHDRRPFFGGTYFPPEDRYGRPGFPTLIRRIDELWNTRRADVEKSAGQIADHLSRAADPVRGELSADWLAHALVQFEASFDEEHGGFGPAPKFPRAFAVSHLLARHAATGRSDLLAMSVATLRAMARGGIHDHLGGGFHRYSTDAEWLVPHFEKMLYDQATLLAAYADGFAATGDAEFARTARGIAAYVLRDLRDPAGGFRSAENADSEGVEGKFYVWTEAEIRGVLGAEEAADFAALYRVTGDGNFLDEARRVRTGANILHLAKGDDAGAGKAASPAVAAMRGKLLAARSARVRPSLDDKVLADWNGLMIGALARAGVALGEPSWIAEAARAAEFVTARMRKDGILHHRWKAGDLAVPAFLEDHAYLALGLLDLYEATFDPRWLAEAAAEARILAAEFQDADGTFRHSSARGETLFFAPKDLYDGALPSGNSAAALALARAARFTGDGALETASRRCLEAWASDLAERPMAYPMALSAVARHVEPSREIVISGDPEDPAVAALLAEVRRSPRPDAVMILRPAAADRAAALAKFAPFTAGMLPVGGRAAAYVCTDRTCAAPVTSAAELAKLLAR